ncbi:MAG: Flp family type IVb pilin [Burkholderiales bacterium]
MLPKANSLLIDESGIAAIEYALIGALIAVVCVATITNVGLNVINLYNAVCNAVSTAVSGAPAC